MPDVLICGADPIALQSLAALLRAKGFNCRTFARLSEAVNACLRGDFGLAIVSLDYPSQVRPGGRLEEVRMIRQISPELPLVVVSDPECLETERELRSLGIFYLLTTPVSRRELWDVVQCALAKRNLQQS